MINKILLLFLIFHCFIPKALAEQCYGNNIFLTTQQEVDDFYTNYSTCDTINFYIRVWGEDITNLNGLRNIKVLYGHLEILNNPSLLSLSGLNSLKYVGGTLLISGNLSLKSLTGLESLDSVGYNLVIENSDIVNLSGLGKLELIRNNLQVQQNAKLLSFEGITNLKKIQAVLSISGNNLLTNLDGLEAIDFIGYLGVYLNSNLINLEGFPAMDSIMGITILENLNLQSLVGLEHLTYSYYVQIDKNPRLNDLIGLDNLKSIGREFTLIENDSLASLDGLGKLEHIETDFVIKMNPRLSNMQSLQSIKTVGQDLIVDRCMSLRNFAGLDSLQYVARHFRVTSNNVLKNLEGLSSLDSIGGDFEIQNNLSLKSPAGLNSLSIIRGNFHLGNNALMDTLMGLEQIREVGKDFELGSLMKLDDLYSLNSLSKIGGIFAIGNNIKLTSLVGVSDVDTLGGLIISDCNNLTDLSALNPIKHIETFISITRNGSLKDLPTLPFIKKLNGTLSLRDNDQMEVVNGLDSLRQISTLDIADNSLLWNINALRDLDPDTLQSVNIQSNPLLEICSIQSICSYLNRDGYAVLDDNKNGCNTREEILAQCLVPVTNLEKENFHIYPNPTSGKLSLTSVIPFHQVQILDYQGRMMETFEDGQLNLEDLPNGIYFLRILTDSGPQGVQILKYCSN